MGEENPKTITKIMKFPNGRNIIHIPIRTPEEEEKHRRELEKAAIRLLRAQERCQMKKNN